MDPRISRQQEFDSTLAPRAICDEYALVQRAIAGDVNALELLFAPHMRRLHRVAFAMLRNNEDAEDTLQEALYKAYNHLDSFQGRSSFSTWLTRIVINSALMTLRKRRSYSESSLDEVQDDRPGWLGHFALDKQPNPEQICGLAELDALIEKQIGKLSPAEQAAFRNYAVDGFSIRESCQALGVPETILKSRIFRTRRKVARGLQCSLERAYCVSSKEKSVHALQSR
jgi:RNA polymerase sigma-70 factor (ECF subfamily)